MSRRSFWAGLGIGTCSTLGGISGIVGTLSFLAGQAIAPDKIGAGNSIYEVPFEIAGSLLGGLLQFFGVACWVATLVFGTLAGIAVWAIRTDTTRRMHATAASEETADPS